MAIEYVSVTIHTRSKGHSAVAAAAYRSAQKLYDERYGKEYNFENKENVIYSCIILPEGTDKRFLNREFLWNQVEKAETKSNARVSKDIVLALPKELSKDEWIELSRRFTEEQFTSNGVAADIAIHENSGNPHCHILVTTRRLAGNIFTEKARDLDGLMRHSAYGDFASQYNTYNTDWKQLQNKYFIERNLNLRVDQNYIIPQVHTGNSLSQEENYLSGVNKNRWEQSRQIALNNPDAVLTLLSMRETVFSLYDIESIAYKQSRNTDEYHKIKNSILNHEKLINLGIGSDGIERYSTKYSIHQEYKLDRYAKAINKKNKNAVSSWKTNLFIKQRTLSAEQNSAVKHIVEKNDLAIVIGKPGTGKTYMLNTAKDIWNFDRRNVYGATVSGIASDNLRKETGIQSRTIASWEMLFDNGFRFTNKDVLIIDEAGMVNLNQMRFLFEHIKLSGAKAVLVGDPDQLNPIGPGAPLRLLANQFGYSEMVDIRRQKIDWQRDITYKLALGDVNSIDAYKDRENLVMLSCPENAKRALIENWKEKLTPQNISSSIIMAHRNTDVSDLNILARSELIASAFLSGEETQIETNSGKLNLLSGERVLFTKNDKDIGIKNGNFATVLKASKTSMEVLVDKCELPVTINLSKYNNISYGYASTIHKLQGVTIDKSYVYYGGKYWNKNLNLVALSRHREDIKIFADTKTHRNYDILKKRLGRAELKDSVLNYPVAFSLRYGVDPDSVIGRAINKINEFKEKINDGWLWLQNKQSYFETISKYQNIDSYITQNGTLVFSSQEKERILRLLHKSNRLESVSKQLYKQVMYSEKYYQIVRIQKELRNRISPLLGQISKDKWIELVKAANKSEVVTSNKSISVSELIAAIKNDSLDNDLSNKLFQKVNSGINIMQKNTMAHNQSINQAKGKSFSY